MTNPLLPLPPKKIQKYVIFLVEKVKLHFALIYTHIDLDPRPPMLLRTTDSLGFHIFLPHRVLYDKSVWYNIMSECFQCHL